MWLNARAASSSIRICRGVCLPGRIMVRKLSSDDRKEHAGEQDFYAKLTGAVCGIIMLIATATGLCLLFLNPAALRGDWSAVGSSAADGAMFWLPWPIGGVLCGVAAVAIQLIKDYRERK